MVEWMECPTRILGDQGSHSHFDHGKLLGDLGPITYGQLDLSYRVVMRKWRKGEQRSKLLGEKNGI